VIPVHLNELSADAARGLIPGLAYQLGILFASPTNSILYALRAWVGYQWALAGFETATIVTLAVIVCLGREAHARSFVRDENTLPGTGFETSAKERFLTAAEKASG
jgi:MFS transporter, SHS family, lactate transporter